MHSPFAPPPSSLLLCASEFVMVGELFKMARIAQKEKTLPGFRAQQWYFFFVATVYMYGRFVRKNLWSEITTDRRLMKVFGGLLRKHNLVSFSLYVAGFIMFVLSLRKRMYLYQFGQYAWTHMILLTVFMPSSFFVSNIFEGIIWLLLPCSLIFTNDIAAYLAGFFFGRTPLIKLSPKKTWEGFVGGLVGTVAAAILLSSVMGRFKWLTCPRTDLSIGYLSCPDDPLYQPRVFTLRDLDPWVPDVVIEHLADLARQPWAPQWLIGSVMSVEITAQPIQIHACFLAVFASLIGPFGGFFASGFKRAFKVKDFGRSIPGHGGMTDRMDCQILMAMFSYLWYHNIIRTAEATVSDVMDMVTSMGRADQLELINRLLEFASSEGLLQGQA
uniref:Phosphatidate cytidylyltransferase n=1 Tax=Tetraselmis sp. GSL018 TaxID=582737 RepID=A0A061S1F2_9CHLO